MTPTSDSGLLLEYIKLLIPYKLLYYKFTPPPPSSQSKIAFTQCMCMMVKHDLVDIFHYLFTYLLAIVLKCNKEKFLNG